MNRIIHPVNRLAFWLGLIALLPLLERQFLYVLGVIVVCIAVVWARERFLRTLPRVRWLMLALGLVYGWTTPGEYFWPIWFSPTHEGVLMGVAQMTRLLVIVASLQVLLTNMKRPAIFAGLHALARPLGWIGLSRDRMALRLTLTLEMMENLFEDRHSIKHLMYELQRPLEVHAERVVVLPVVPMTWKQQGFLLLQLLCVVSMLWLGGFGSWA